jgi:hypothetical protein
LVHQNRTGTKRAEENRTGNRDESRDENRAENRDESRIRAAQKQGKHRVEQNRAEQNRTEQIEQENTTSRAPVPCDSFLIRFFCV